MADSGAAWHDEDPPSHIASIAHALHQLDALNGATGEEARKNSYRTMLWLLDRIAHSHPEDELPSYEYLFQPDTLGRLRTMLAEAPELYYGIFEPWVHSQRPRLLFYNVHKHILASGTLETPALDPFVFTDAAAIMAEHVHPRRWLIDGMIADGLTLLGGSPKGGKTYLAYALALAVATGGKWCGQWEPEQGKVLYFSLEDDAQDTHLRIAELLPNPHLQPGRLIFMHGATTLPAFGEGLIEWLAEAVELHEPRLLIIDPISYLYVLKKSGSQFEETKDMLVPLRELGKAQRCAMVCLDHRRKRSRDDVLMVDTLYGSVAKQAVADGIIMVNRDHEDIELDMTVRHGREQKCYIKFEFQHGQCFLTYKGGEVEPVNVGDLRHRIIELLRVTPHPLTNTDIMLELNLPDSRQTRNNLSQILYRCMKAREIEKLSRGRFIIGEQEV